MSIKQQRENRYIQEHMYDGKSSKSIYKGLKTSFLILICLLLFGWVNYQKLLQYQTGLKTNEVLYWLYDSLGINLLTIIYIAICIAVLAFGIFDVKRLKNIKTGKNKYRIKKHSK